MITSLKYKAGTLVAFIAILLLLILLNACGVNYHLKKAQRHIDKARSLGAVVKRDTLFKTIKLKTPPLQLEAKFEKPCLTGVIEVTNSDGKKAIVRVDTVEKKVFVECPEHDHDVTVPVAVETNIQTPLGFWYYLPRIGIPALIMGFMACIFLRRWGQIPDRSFLFTLRTLFDKGEH